MRNPFEYLDHKEKTRRSNEISHLSEYEKITNKRIRNIMIIIVVLFSIILIQLFSLQVLKHDKYVNLLAQEQRTIMYENSARGEIFDRNGKDVALTKTVLSISYFPKEDLKSDEVDELALKFAKQFDMTSKDLTEDDLKVLWIRQSEVDGKMDYGTHLLTDDERATVENTAKKDQEKVRDQLVKAHISDDMIEDITEDEKLEFLVSQRMDHFGNSNNKRTIVQGVSEDQLAYLVEHENEFPGFEPNYSSWDREYVDEDGTFKSVLGSVTSATQGLPVEQSAEYLAQGYAITDRVGSSGLEKQYQNILFGSKTQKTFTRNEQGEVVSTVAKEGQKGYDLHLSIDMEFQKAVDDILKANLEDAITNSARGELTEMFVNVMNPQTGEVYVMSGMKRNENNDIFEYASGNYLSVYEPGSSIKGATVYMGLNEGVVSPGEVIPDTAIEIKGTSPKKSYTYHGLVNDISALEKSSNVYMFHIAIRLGGATYIPNEVLGISNDKAAEAYKLMRNYYSSFGLGVATGIDVPNEVNEGFIGMDNEIGKLLDYVIGQYDQYTPIQLGVYAATIANGGYSVTPRLVTTGTDVNQKDKVIYENPITVNNKVIGDTEYLDRVQQGFRDCVVGPGDRSYCGGGLNSLPFPVYAKTGTAEVGNGDTNNELLVGYVGSDVPQLSFACVAPESIKTSLINDNTNICSTTMTKVLQEAYNRGYTDKN